ncbi:MAG: SDR family NAD(P)-dependent oxidoreductase [Microthrixaceae bacterium]
MEHFEGRVAVITGGASGIGLAMAKRFAVAGMSLVIADVDADALVVAAGEIEAVGAPVTTVLADVSRLVDVERIAAAALDAFGAIHLACNNAGVATGGVTWEMSDADWRWVLDVDLWGVVHGIRTFTPHIIEAGGGHVVNTASMAGVTSPPFMGPYNAAKHAVVAISETMFHELAVLAPAVGVSVLCPGWVRTGIHRSERHRPTVGEHASSQGSASDPEAPVAGGAGSIASEMSSIIGGFVEQGLDPADVAETVFEAVRDRRFYVLTHPEWANGVRRDVERMLTGQDPVSPIGV